MAKEEVKDTPAMPSLVGMTPEMLQTLLSTLGSTSATAMREAIRSQRKENPSYPERSVFNPAGVFDDEGKALVPRLRLSRPTIFVGVRLSDETMTSDEIELCNRFTENKNSRDGMWSAEIEDRGTAREKLIIKVPCRTADDRMILPPLTHILRELLSGADAVNPDSMAKRLEQLEAEVKRLRGGTEKAA